MDSSIHTTNSALELQNKVSGYLDELVKRTDAASVSEEMVRFLDFSSRFHQYSPNNLFLIMLSRPDSTRVAGYNQWLKLGRYVKRNEHGIKILAPIIYKELDSKGKEISRLSGFKVTNVFDVTQTEGAPLPRTPDWISSQKKAELQKKLIQFAKSKGIDVVVEELDGEIQGVSLGKLIKLSPQAGSKTLIHEICHEVLHRVEKNPLPHALREMQAEATAYVVSRFFGLEGLQCPNYIVLNGATAGDILRNLSVINKTANGIIEGVLRISQQSEFDSSVSN